MPQYIIQYDQGTAPGPFNIYLSGSSGLSLYASNITKAQLDTGFVISFNDLIPSTSVVIDNIAFGCATEEILPFPSQTPSYTPSVTITPSITATPSITPTITPSITPSPTITPTRTITPTLTPTLTPSITPSPSINAPSLTPSMTVSVTPSYTPTRTPTTTPIPVYRQYYFTAGTATVNIPPDGGTVVYKGLNLAAIHPQVGFCSAAPAYGAPYTPTLSTQTIPNYSYGGGYQCGIINVTGGTVIIPYGYPSNDFLCLDTVYVNNQGLFGFGLGNNSQGGAFNITPGTYNITVTNLADSSNTVTYDIPVTSNYESQQYTAGGVATNSGLFDFTVGANYQLTINFIQPEFYFPPFEFNPSFGF
jgi:hypothetical protein